MKLWSGRFVGDTDKRADDFNSSLSFDKRMFRHDIMGSIAHCTMLGECNIIPKKDADTICKALAEIEKDIIDGKVIMEDAEDIHMFIETVLTKRIGDTGKKLHTARSRNDQVALDLRLYLRDVVTEFVFMLKKLIEVIIEISSKNLDTIIPAYTHMQKAQPSTLAHHYMAYAEMFMRDIERLNDCFKRINVLPLGACALAGTTYPTDRKRVAELLNFPSVTYNSMDSVSDRDFAIEFLSCCSVIMMHLSRFNEEIIYWATDEFNYIELDDKYSTGSSIMPQKKNPDMSELIRGKTGRCYGSLMSLLTTMKSLPLAYNKDMQEDKQGVFDTEDTVRDCLDIFTAMLPTLKFKKDNLLFNAGGGYTVATDCADYLVKKGLPFREAHSVSGKMVLYCQQANIRIDELKIEEFKTFSPLFEKDILDDVKLQNVVGNRKTIGGPAPSSVKESIKQMQKKLSAIKEK